MPVMKCPGTTKYRIGSGPCIFDSKEKADRAYKAYLYKKYGAKEASVLSDLGVIIVDEDMSKMSEEKLLEFERLGRNEGNKSGSGPGGTCVCPGCGHTQSHETGVPCYDIKCPKCGKQMQKS